MSITENSQHKISLERAAQLTANYRNNFATNETGNFIQPIAFAFGKNEMLELLRQEKAVGFRIYMGMKEDGQFTPVICAVDESNNDMYEDILLDIALPCPSDCSSSNPLNSI